MTGSSPEPARALDFLKQVEEFLNKINKSKKSFKGSLVKRSAHGIDKRKLETEQPMESSSVRLSKTSDQMMWSSDIE